jgi:2-polyprenyl-6-methoxyphenol hydroxylase-like FAD-dependent oxidoreductase
VEAAEQIGLYPRLAAVGYKIDAADYVDLTGRQTCSISYERFTRLAGGKVLSLLRPDMERAAREALFQDVPPGRVQLRYGARVTRAGTNHKSAYVQVEHSPAETFTADLLIGADGIHSKVRAQVFGPEPEYLKPLGMRAAAFIVEDAALNATLGNRFMLTDTIDRMAGLYGLRGDLVAAFLVYRDRGAAFAGHTTAGTFPSTRDRLRNEFAGTGAAVQRILQLCPEDPYDDVVAQIVMPNWWKGRAVLVGDSGGAVSLLAGQGGSLAVAGAALLGNLLGTTVSAESIEASLDRFEQRWRPLVETAQASGRRTAASFLPANRFQRLVRRWIIRATQVPGIDRAVARQILRTIAK